MNTVWYGLASILVLAACSDGQQTTRVGSNVPTTSQPGSVSAASAPTPTTASVAYSSGPDLSNVVPSDGKVTTTLGPMVNVQSARALTHVFQAPSGPVPGRIYLSHQVIDSAGAMLNFAINYVAETEPLRLEERGVLTKGAFSDLSMEDQATRGIVRISSESEGQLTVHLEGIEMAHREADGVTLTPRPPLGDGSFVGAVERVCFVDSYDQPHADLTWSNPFCAPYAK